MRITLAQSQCRAAVLEHVAEAEIFRVQLRWHAVLVCMLQNFDQSFRHLLLFDYSIMAGYLVGMAIADDI